MAIYVIGFKEHVELREAKTPPVALTSEVRIPYRGLVLDRETGRMRESKRAGHYTLKVVRHRGGKVLRTMRAGWFSAYTGIYVNEGEMQRVEPDRLRRLPGGLHG